MSGIASLKTESKLSPSVPPSSLRLRIRRKSTDTFIHGIDDHLLELITDVHSAEDSASFLLPSAAGLLRSPTAADIFVRSRIIRSMYPAGGMRPRLLARLARILTRAARNATRRRKGGVVVTGTVEIWRNRDLMTEEEDEGMVARCGGCGCAIYSLKEYDESTEDYGGPFCLDCREYYAP
ncbi:unnamed protein product [Cuscuta campestris]|uniref:Uncharacterized protein n=1 Tax=Cuscuta campestris TaxID=132261 RepID=A0A484NDC8_9ASTE|nr:unnamed protein product [Cuscuta campestris]